MPPTWKELYDGPVQGVWGLLVVPTLFLATLVVRGWRPGRGMEPYAAGFVRGWTLVFGVLTLLDPICTGPLKLPLLPFVLLGDYRVFALLLVVMQPGRARAAALAEAVAWTLVVPLVAGAAWRLAGLSEILLWTVYEACFVTLALAFAVGVVPRRVGAERARVRRYCRAVLAYVALYYALWGAADVAVWRGRDWGWALRIVPNQLYYGGLVPVAYALFFARHARSSSSTHAAR